MVYMNWYMNVLKFIKIVLNSWEPQDPFWTCAWNPTHKIRKPKTKLGKWFDNMPLVLSVPKIFYYILAWPVYIVSNIIWAIIESFLTKKVRESL